MTQIFAELGLRPELVAAADACGFEDPTTLQRSAIPVIRRGGNVVMRASAGAGVTAAYGLAIVDRLAGGSTEEMRGLVIAPSVDRASAIATALGRLADGTGVSVRAAAPGWSDSPVTVTAATAESVLHGVRDSTLKLESVEVLVLDGLSIILALEGLDTLETLLGTVPAAAQRVVVTAEWTRDVERLAQAHARRAIEIPSRPADPALAAPPARRGELSYIVVTSASKDEALFEVLARRSGAPAVIITRTAARAARLRELLRLRGFDASADGGGSSISVVGALDAARASIAYDVPADPQVMERMEPGSGLLLVSARELPHLRSLARETGFDVRALGGRAERGSMAAFRQRVRRALEEEDIDAQLLLLDPLFEEYSAAEVAAALSALLRARAPSAEPAATPAEAEEQARPAAFVRVFISIGQRDGIRPADVVGAFTGEAGIKGEQIGRIDIRDTFSVVEVESAVADRIIRALNGTTMRGRSMRVDFDRKTTTAPRKGRASRA